MSSFKDIDPRLRDTASNAFSQHAHNNAPFQTPLAPSTSRSPVGPPQRFDSPIGNPYLPQTPQSGGNATDHDGGNSQSGGGADDPKRTRACEACRGLKVRCEPDPNNGDGPCKRCAKANRNCVVTVPNRKRQKKTDSRVAELEKKIDALTQSLAQKSAGIAPTTAGPFPEQQGMGVEPRRNAYQQVTNGGFDSLYASRPEVRAEDWSYPKEPEFVARKNSAPPMVVAGQKRKHLETREYSSTPESSARKLSETPNGFLVDTGNKPAPNHEYADVIDRGVLTADMAAKMFECYIEKMVPHMPAVVFPAGTTAADVRKTTPTLFLAILSAASGSNYPELQRMLTKEVMSIYADRVICNGEKTLELIQALHVSTLWYWPPEHFEELKFYQLIHIAAVMAIDIGMGKKNKSSKAQSSAGLWRDHPWRRTPYPDPESIDARRAWLACYFLCCNASMGLRRPNLIRWTSFIGDCVEVLETSPEAAPTDKILCQWVRSQHIAEEIGTRFSMDDPGASVSITDQNVQYALKGFELDLEKWSKNIPPEVETPTLRVTEHVVNLYMHEVAMHVDHNVEEFKPPFTEDNLRGMGDKDQPIPLSNAHIKALSTCLTSIDRIFETFLQFDVETIRCLPVANFVRVAYAVVVLIKMYFAAAQPNSELGQVINKDHMKVEQYLDGLVGIFRASAAEEKSRPSGKFLMVLLMLKTWFHRQRGPPGSVNESAKNTGKQGESSAKSSDAAQPSAPEQRNGQQSGYSPANTPLQLLSEVATGNSGGQSRSDTMANYPGGNNDWQPTPTQVSYQNYPPMNMFGMYGTGGPPSFDPQTGLDYGYTIGDGVEQAMGMPPGLGDFGTIFNDDAFFSGIMDSVGQGISFEGL
ncbi:uncharacterized protein LY89DRAFT_637013 [Mollisia scopiformis]|uniref:Zn(2)-C6 fungal-type domain-containing protein n=1 Tax=Mollisia scopiformis TaxID=149040 RepID=A0A194XRS3_MOLSC|nr:uncharacterized protein LY89DRAFT_637013 [Mollisia scopiformis]KUJ22749.1 hypothetical protein LY89DRAFT_637013 [Mollisia scopiformis]